MSEENAETSTTAESESTKTVEAVDITEENNAAEDDEDANLEDLEAEMKKLEEEERKLAAQEAALDQAIEKSSNVPVDDKSVYVGSVDYSTTPEQLKNHFKSCGSIERVTILVNKFTGRPKGFAYVRFVRGFVSFEEF